MVSWKPTNYNIIKERKNLGKLIELKGEIFNATIDATLSVLVIFNIPPPSLF